MVTPMNDKVMPIPSYQPLYGQIKALLVNSLASGEWKPGEMIPSEVELAARFGVSQGTVRKAIDELATDNLLMRRQGRGTFVATHAEDSNTTRFLRFHADDGRDEGHESRLVDCRCGRAGPRAAIALGRSAGSAVVEVQRVLLFGGRPLIHEHLVLPGDAFAGLDATTIGDWQGSMYSLFETRFGVRMIRAEERLTAVASPAAVSGLLDVASGSPLLAVERVAYTYEDVPMEWRLGHYLTAGYHYLAALD